MPEGFRLEGDLQANIGLMGPQHKRAMVAAANYIAPQAVTYMRANAKWTDRTGNARSGLQSKVVVSKNRVAVVLYHTMPYGVWLEIRHDGRFAIIRPAVQAMAPKFVEAIGKLMFK